MTSTQQQEHFDKLVARMRDTMLSKGNDYATDDRLANFKQAAAITNLQPVQVALVMIAVKISRLSNLLAAGKTPENEAVADTTLDLAVYAILTDALIQENG